MIKADTYSGQEWDPDSSHPRLRLQVFQVRACPNTVPNAWTSDHSPFLKFLLFFSLCISLPLLNPDAILSILNSNSKILSSLQRSQEHSKKCSGPSSPLERPLPKSGPAPIHPPLSLPLPMCVDALCGHRPPIPFLSLESLLPVLPLGPPSQNIPKIHLKQTICKGFKTDKECYLQALCVCLTVPIFPSSPGPGILHYLLPAPRFGPDSQPQELLQGAVPASLRGLRVRGP